MIRPVIAAAAAVLMLAFLSTTPVAAQESPGPTVIDTTVENTTSTTADVGGEEVTTTTVDVGGEEVTSTTGAVTGQGVTTTTPIQVAGKTVTRGIPRTGGDIGGPAVIGLALTGAGIALAVGARRRRKQLEGA